MIPNYHLYGEEKRTGFPDILHCESIAARSQKHNWVIAPHRHHSLHQIFWIRQGGGKMTVDGRIFELQDRQIISIPPNAVHGFEFVQNTQGHVLTIPSQRVRQAFENLPDLHARLTAPAIIGAQEPLTLYLLEISKEHRRAIPGRPEMLLHLSSSLILTIARDMQGFHKHSPSSKDRKLAQIQTFQSNVEANFKIRHKAQFYADIQHITLPHLTRLCRQVLGKPASEVIQERLLLEARRSLVYTRLPVGEIAYELGFADPAHFSKFFKSGTGKAPSTYREKADAPTRTQPADRILQALQKAGQPKGH
ncbi:MAG: helix-turn-helix domain-containing protein [Sneathiella sp.]|nr:helix-turn-helix domain-containing protein [Sneathiella sp.]